MSLLSRLFGGSTGKGPDADPVTHEGFRITPTPMRDGNAYRVSARIEKEIDGVLRQHTLVRADTFNTLDAAAEGSIAKAKMAIDSLGDTLFD